MERRLWAEWDLLRLLTARNPHRLTDLVQQDDTFFVTLQQTPAISLSPESERNEHRARIVFPQFFPAVPMEMYLGHPVFHPNVHPHTGFVCLWDRHRVTNTVEHALHKLVAILGWRLYNGDPVHVMQEDALQRLQISGEEVRAMLAAPGLLGSTPAVALPAQHDVVVPGSARRRRLL